MTFFLINFSLAFCLIDFCIMKMWIIPHLVGDTLICVQTLFLLASHSLGLQIKRPGFKHW